MEEVAAAAIVDARGTVTGWSEGARRLTGYPAEEVVGRAAQDLLAEGTVPPALTALTGTVVVRHRNGRPMPLRLSAVPMTGPDGSSLGFVVVTAPESEDALLVAQAFQQAPVAMSVFDTGQRYLRANDRAAAIMHVDPAGLAGRYFPDTADRRDEHDQLFHRHLRRVAESGLPVHYESFSHVPSHRRERAWTIDMWPVYTDADQVTAVATSVFDNSEQHWARQRLVLLNEAATAIGTTLDVLRTAEELLEVVIPRFADFASVDLLDWVLDKDEPPKASGDDVVLRRIAHLSVTEGVPEAAVRLGDRDTYQPLSPPVRALREGRPVLRRAGERDFDRWVQQRNAQDIGDPAYRRGAHSMVTVPLRARGTTLGVVVFVRVANPDPYAADDAVLAEELASRAAVCFDNARRFARERSTALALQHSLLPRGLAEQAALDIAHRYLPSGSQAGIGGDWFDVIPLSGGRVALVVGDVVGHGIRSSATMGRLRTAVRTLADVDLPPDELLTHLDDLVTHLAADESGEEEVGELGATCLYAVYDPVSRRLALAAAGHPAPVVLQPDGGARLVAMSAGPPLGVGGLPFEETELDLPEGSLIALYTNGLIEGRDRDLDRGVMELCRALETSRGSLDDLCDKVVKSVLPDERGDDVALLLARSRALGADQVATWDVSLDPSQVAITRQYAVEQLADWGLGEIAYVTELVVSELVTNAIRYGGPPIQLRLIRDRSLICEVSDGSSTSPHLRRAHAFDEGGRGLLLVAQLTQRWGSRQTNEGKTIWAEQPLPA
ncbi:SpoIIE family protein phosphatase [Streptomyces chiangmaiensis]|uniref:SpoIIE family protein phosphatase n=1 Tax=Streptomyces chiangmaiensis TaxID=766497 RepID=A0ABU7FF87_9ACTN|nr:SpoIIE family protein phosphatase [Streptomyces chiangmaiensis]MED7822812.1 SpoIIE family protein phosphatase [Streptomyces chiangmaiensis]